MVFYIKLNQMESKKKNKSKTPKKVKEAEPVNVSQLNDSEDETELPDYGNGINTLGDESNDVSLDESGWSSDDDVELARKVKAYAKPNDKVQYKTRLKQLDWSNIAFKNFSAEDCAKRFEKHLKNVRHHRNLDEIVTDVQANLKKCPVKKPLNSYQLFIQEQLTAAEYSGDFAEKMKNLATMYKNLAPEERAAYEQKSNTLRAEYFKKKAEFESSNPLSAKKRKTPKSIPTVKTPFHLFIEHNKLIGNKDEYQKMRETYANLPFDDKYKWVIQAVSLAPGESISKILNKDEQRIFKGQVRQTPSAYGLFIKDMYPKLRDKVDSHKVMKECAMRWKTLEDKKKQKYVDAAGILKEKASLEQEKFNERHGIATPKKRRKSVAADIIVQESDDDEPLINSTPVKKSKKQKVSSSEISIPKTPTPNNESDAYATPATVTPSKKSKKRKESLSSTAVDSGADEPIEKRVKKEMLSPSKSLTPIKKSSVPIPMTTIHSPLRAMEKKRLQLQSQTSESNNEAVESDTADSSVSASAKKKTKKDKKSKEVQPPGSKPPNSLLAYFAQYVHTGKPKKAEKAFGKLTKKERKRLNAEYNDQVENYVTRLKTYLNSLPKDEAVAYISKIKAEEDAARTNGDNNDDTADTSS